MTPEAFEDEAFSDFIVHETAHVLHNCKRRTLGLREACTKEWLLDIDFAKRETFAYSCEAYSRVLARAKNAAGRRPLADEHSRAAAISEERVDPNEVASIIAEAAASRNGWKIAIEASLDCRYVGKRADFSLFVADEFDSIGPP